MFATRFTYKPALGKSQEMQTLLEARVNARQAAGVRLTLSRKVVLTDGQEFRTTVFSDTLAEWEANRSRTLADPATAGFFQKVETLSRAPIASQVFEQHLAPLAPPKSGEFVWIGVGHPALGRGSEWKEASLSLLNGLQKNGVNIGLWTQHFTAPHGEMVLYLAPLKKLKDVGDLWQALAKTPSWAALVKKWPEMLRQSPGSEVVEVLIGPPPQGGTAASRRSAAGRKT